jgi:hypothetical protein
MKVAFGAFSIIAPFSMEAQKLLSYSRGNNDGNGGKGGYIWWDGIQFHGITMLNDRTAKKEEKRISETNPQV